MWDAGEFIVSKRIARATSLTAKVECPIFFDSGGPVKLFTSRVGRHDWVGTVKPLVDLEWTVGESYAISSLESLFLTIHCDITGRDRGTRAYGVPFFAEKLSGGIHTHGEDRIRLVACSIFRDDENARSYGKALSTQRYVRTYFSLHPGVEKENVSTMPYRRDDC